MFGTIRSGKFLCPIWSARLMVGSETAFRTSAQDHTRAENLALTAVSEVLSVAYEFTLCGLLYIQHFLVTYRHILVADFAVKMTLITRWWRDKIICLFPRRLMLSDIQSWTLIFSCRLLLFLNWTRFICYIALAPSHRLRARVARWLSLHCHILQRLYICECTANSTGVAG